MTPSEHRSHGPGHDQAAYDVRLEWGLVGADLLGPGAATTVVVDVLSFTTTTTVALEAGAVVLPYRWRDETAPAYAAEHDAVLAVDRDAAVPDQVSLAPGSFRVGAVPDRVVLPSPNGATISAALADAGTRVVAGCLRNRIAVADALAEVLAGGGAVAVVPAGERWPDGSLRPAVEDLWGAGAVLAALDDLGVGSPSPEAGLAVAAYRAVAEDLGAALAACASGRELVERGHRDDVLVAAEVDSSLVVPRLADGCFSA